MEILMTILAVVLLGLSVVMVFLVLSQDVKGGGLAGALGGGSVQTAFGGRSAESVAKLTAWLAVAFFVIILAMNVFKPGTAGGLRDEPGRGAPMAPAPEAPAAPVAPVTPEAPATPAPATPAPGK